MKSVIRGVVAGAWCLLLCAGCGGSSSDSDASCTNSSACGGDITGKWTITSSCIGVTAMNMANPQCPGASVSGSDLKVSGSITYNDDLTYTSTSTISGSTSVTLPASCLSMGGITVSCDQLTQVFSMLSQDPAGGFKSGSCSSAGSGCTCKLVLADQTSTGTGTYSTTSDGVLTDTMANGTASETDYCVKGTKLTESPRQTVNMGAMGQMGVSGTIVLSKQ